MLYQSHILKFRVNDNDRLNRYLFFLSLNSPLVQRQIRNVQFTADIIDTIGNRYKELILPIPRNQRIKDRLIQLTSEALGRRIRSKIAIKQMPILVQSVLESNSIESFDGFFNRPLEAMISHLVQDTTTLEFGEFSTFVIKESTIRDNIFLPKYYDPMIKESLKNLSRFCFLRSIQDMISSGAIELSTGDEIGKSAYGTGSIPFVRTSDFSNWEIKADTKQGVSEIIYAQYSQKEDVQAGDILVVRDGTYLVGNSCIITDEDKKMLFCGGLIKIRVNKSDVINEYLLLALLNSYIVKRQIRTKQFTRDVIDTLGHRLS